MRFDLATAVLAGLAATTVAAPAAACPDYALAPTFGHIELSAGFTPDPYVRNITAGGSTSIANCGGTGWAGFVTTAPDFDLYWNGSSAQLTIAVQSVTDAVLLINAPDGTWYYIDDYRGTDPAAVFQNPQAGLYDIWVGSYDGSSRNPGILVITELAY